MAAEKRRQTGVNPAIADHTSDLGSNVDETDPVGGDLDVMYGLHPDRWTFVRDSRLPAV
jgi:hypothetical protein